MKYLSLFLVCVPLFYVTTFAAGVPDVPALQEAVKKYYDTVDRAKVPYENELRKVLANTQKAGNLRAYNAIEAELEHTIGKNGHCYTAFTPSQGSAMFARKMALKRAVDSARQEFKDVAEKLAAEHLKNGFVDSAREIDLFAKAIEPPRLTEVDTVRTVQVDWSEAPLMKHVLTLPRIGHLLEWSPDDKIIATSGAMDYFTLWDSSTGRELATHHRRSDKERGSGVVWSKDGKALFFCGTGGEVGRWNVETRKVVWESKGQTWMYMLALSPDERALYTVSDNGVHLWNAETGTAIQTLSDSGKMTTIAFSNRGDRFATTSDKVAIVWDTRTRRPIHRLQGHTDNVSGVTFSPDDQIIVTGANDNTAIIWNGQTGTPIQRLVDISGHAIGAAFTPDGTKLAVARNWGGAGVIIFDTRTWKVIAFAPGHGLWNAKMGWDSKGERLATGGNDVRIWTMPGK